MKIRRAYGVLWAFAVGLVLMASVLPTVDRGPERAPSSRQNSTEVPLAQRDRPLAGMKTAQVPRSPFHGDRWDNRPQSRTRSQTLVARAHPETVSRQNVTPRSRATAPEQAAEPLRPILTPVEGSPNTFALPGVLCKEFVSADQEYAPIQVVDEGVPQGSDRLTWVRPTYAQYEAPFSGSPGSAAGHEGIDYVNTDADIAEVAVVVAATGRVAYVRSGCPQSRMFGPNRQRRECGAGWGNHVVVDHGNGVFSRYAHLAPRVIPVRVGDRVEAGQLLGQMGNTGRSDTRHLHFEVGVAETNPDACAPSQSFARVHDPALLGI